MPTTASTAESDLKNARRASWTIILTLSYPSNKAKGAEHVRRANPYNENDCLLRYRSDDRIRPISASSWPLPCKQLASILFQFALATPGQHDFALYC